MLQLLTASHVNTSTGHTLVHGLRMAHLLYNAQPLLEYQATGRLPLQCRLSGSNVHACIRTCGASRWPGACLVKAMKPTSRT
jgi:hypothetical protein